jgi:6-phosphogluconolactonase (cycloisomerase 2 family)
VFSANPSGALNEAPVATITGSNTGLQRPSGIALDASGRIYVANYSAGTITVYAANPVGTLNEAPLATIGGANTGLNGVIAVAVDSVGCMYAAVDYDPGTILVFPANPSGTLNEFPLQTIAGTNAALIFPYGIAVR